MAEKLIRIGRVSSINYETGMIKILYPDLDDSVTDDLPYISLNGEYKMPSIGQNVLVLHLSNGTAAGVIMGPFWNEGDPPPEGGADLFRKDISKTPGESYVRYEDGTLKIKAPTLVFETDNGTISMDSILAKLG